MTIQARWWKERHHTYLPNGAAIRAERERVGMSQRELAERSGFSPMYICDIEHERRTVPEQTLVAVVRALAAKEEG